MHVLIVEDELIVARDLQRSLERRGIGTADVAASYTEALQALQQRPYQLALLDIHLEGYKTGIDVAGYLNEHCPMPFIFLTSYEDAATMTAALSTKPKAYLQKPFTQASLQAAMVLALQAGGSEEKSTQPEQEGHVINDAVFVRERNGCVRVPLRDVLYIRSDGNYMELCTAGRKYLVRVPQKVLLEQLPPHFRKTHKSYIVNRQAITAVQKSVVMLGHTEVPLAPGYRDDLLIGLPVL